MNRNKRKILVLSDLKENTNETLKYALHISKEINGALELFYVKKLTEIITTENPLSAMRDISSECIKTEKAIKSTIQNITKDNFVPIKTSFEFGHIKSELDNYIKESNPDFIIIGKKVKKFLNFSDDNITVYLIKNYPNKVVIADNTNHSKIFEILNTKLNTRQIAS